MQFVARVVNLSQMNPKAKKPKRDTRRPIYVRVRPEEHTKIVQIAKKRGWPHTIASVATEMISRGLDQETEVSQKKGSV